MKLLTTLSALLTLLSSAYAQDMPDMTPPVELAQLEGMLGTWTAKLKVYAGPEPMECDTTMKTAKTVGGRFIQSTMSMNLGPMGMMEGLELLSYDAGAKKWRAWWFDQTDSKAIELEGTLEGKKLVLTSKATKLHGMPGKVVIRSTSTIVSDNETTFLLEMKNDGQDGDSEWTKMFEGTFRKAASATDAK